MTPNEILSKINNTAIADNIKTASLELLQDESFEKSLKGNNLFLDNKTKSILQFSQLLKTNPNAPINEFEKTYYNINNQSFNITSPFLDKLIKNNQKDKAKELLDKVKFNKLSVHQQVNYAIILAQLNNVEKAKAIIETAYSQNEKLTDGFARIGWQIYWANKKYDKVIEFCRIDEILNRISPAWRIHLAQAYAASGDIDKAKKEVKIAYSDSPTLRDGYSRIGWEAYWDKKEYDKIIKLCRLDRKLDRILPAWRIHLAQAYAATGDIDKAKKEVEFAYSDSPNLKDGYSRIGWQTYWDKKEYKPLSKLFYLDEKSNRLSLNMQINQAKTIASLKGMEDACVIIDSVYRKDKNLKNTLSQIAWQKYIPIDMAYDKVLPFLEKDMIEGRLTEDWLLNYAQTLAINGNLEKAESIINEAYDKYPNLVNGFARCAYFSNFLFDYKPQIALEWFEKDKSLNRLNDQYKINHAVLYATNNDFSIAKNIVDKVYTENYRITSGYSLIGWYYYGVNKKDPIKAMNFLKKDLFLERSNISVENILAGLYAYLDDKNKALQIINKNYLRYNNNLSGCYMLIGFANFASNNNLAFLKEMIEKDYLLNKLYFKFMKDLRNLVNKNKTDDSISYLYAKRWLNRICLIKELKLK